MLTRSLTVHKYLLLQSLCLGGGGGGGGDTRCLQGR